MERTVRKIGSEPAICHRCQKCIYDGTIFRVGDRYWHNSCLQCLVCCKPLTGVCHVKGNDVYCRTDFARLFGTKCTGCHETIPPHETVRVARDSVYHLACFTCVACTCVIQTGSYVYTRNDGKLICSEDYKKLLQNDGFPSDSGADESGPEDSDSRYQSGINDTQLHMLVHVFQSNKRPARHVRERLSRETGLSMRAVQIWFRNERVKERNNMLVGSSNLNCQIATRINDQMAPVEAHSISQEINITRKCNSWPASYQTEQTNSNHYHKPDVTHMTSPYQLYCPLDYLVPDEMPPNVDLSAADICNGEVVAGKYQYDNRKFPMFNEQSRANMMADNNRPWISV